MDCSEAYDFERALPQIASSHLQRTIFGHMTRSLRVVERELSMNSSCAKGTGCNNLSAYVRASLTHTNERVLDYQQVFSVETV